MLKQIIVGDKSYAEECIKVQRGFYIALVVAVMHSCSKTYVTIIIIIQWQQKQKIASTCNQDCIQSDINTMWM